MKLGVLFTAVCVCLTALNLNGQNESAINSSIEKIETTDSKAIEAGSVRHNWFIDLGVGFANYFGDHNKQLKYKDLISPTFELQVGKWFSPSVGMRLGFSGFIIRGATQNNAYAVIDKETGEPKKVDYRQQGFWLNYQKIPYFDMRADFLFNMCNMFGGYKSDRFYSAIPYVGIGFAHSWQTKDTKEWRQKLIDNGENIKFSDSSDSDPKYITETVENTLTGTLGFLNTFRINSSFDVYLDVRGTLYKDAFDMEYESRGRAGEGLLATSVGLIYKFKPRGFTTRTNTIKHIVNQADVSDLQNELDQMLAVRDSLSKTLEDVKEQGPIIYVDTVTVKKNVNVVSKTTILFGESSVELSKDARVNLGMFATLVQNFGAEQKYEIIGYYRSEGNANAELDELMAMRRAEVVKNCLIEEFRVSPDQLIVTTSSDADFDELSAYERSVVIQAAE